MKRDLSQEKKVLAQLYANKADSVKFLPFFFRDKKQLRHFFNMFGGKTLTLPDTYESFMEFCLRNDDLPSNQSMCGINENIHARTKNRIVESYLMLFDNIEDAIMAECKDSDKR